MNPAAGQGNADTLPWVSNRTAQQLKNYLQVSYPIVLLVLFVAAFTARSIITSSNNDNDDKTKQVPQVGPGGKPLPSNKARKKSGEDANIDFSAARKRLFAILTWGVILTFLGNIIIILVHALLERKEGWWCGIAPTIYLTGSFMIYALLVIAIYDTKPAPTAAHLITWVASLLMEIVLLGASAAVYATSHREPKSGKGRGKLREVMTEWEITEIVMDTARIFLVLALIAFFALFQHLLQKKTKRDAAADSEESTALLSGAGPVENGSADRRPNGYGTTNGKPAGPHGHGHADTPAGWEKPTTTPSRSWWEYIRAYRIFVPYIWPYKDRRLQVYFVICIAIVVLQRGIQILVPYQVGHITDILAGESGERRMPWNAIMLYVLYRIFQGSNGLFGAARQILWIPIEQYSYREISVAAFEHVHMLSLEFHLGKKTGEVLSALGKGASSTLR